MALTADTSLPLAVCHEEILHALDNAIRYREQEYDGELRLFVIGVDQHGKFLELVLVPAREAGDSWTAIGMALRTSKQNAYRKYGQKN